MVTNPKIGLVDNLVKRFGPLPIALAGGLALGLLTLTIPNHLIESLVSATGISEMISFAAPPLGIKARIAIAFGTALFAFGILALLLVRDGDDVSDQYNANERPYDLKFASDFEKEAQLKSQSANTSTLADNAESKPRKMGIKDRIRAMMPVIRDATADDVRELEDLPKLRREDRHPDAPPRAPLRAGRDLGNDLTNKAVADQNTEESTGAVANMRKRLGGLIPRDLINEDNMADTPLVAKKTKAADPSPQPEPQPKPLPEPDAALIVNNGDTYAEQAPSEPVAASPIASPIIAAPEPVLSEDVFVEDAAIPAETAPPVQNYVQDEVDRQDGGSSGNLAAAADGAAYAKPAIANSVDETVLQDLDLSQLIDRLEQGLERLSAITADDKTLNANVYLNVDAPASSPSVSTDSVSLDKTQKAERGDAKRDNAPAKAADFAADKENSVADITAAKTGAKQTEPSADSDDIVLSEPITDPEDMDEALRAALETLRQMTAGQQGM